MLDVDTVSTFMLSIVTNYFTVCGDSLEDLLDDTTDSRSKASSSTKKETLDFKRQASDPVVAYSADGMTICQSIDLVENEGEPFEIQRMNGTDMIFFPRPSSEMPFSKKSLLGTKNPLPDLQQQVLRNRSLEKMRLSETENPTFMVPKVSRISIKNVISPPREVASKWVALGLLKENIKHSVPSQHEQRHGNHQNQQFPFDEMKFENTKRRPPLATRGQSRRQKQIMPRIGMTGVSRFGPDLSSVKNSSTTGSCRNGTESLQVVRRTVSRTTQTNDRDANDDDLYRLSHDTFVIEDFVLPQDQPRYKNQTMPSHWRSAVDPRSGQTYYFHEITRETQWRKPMELASNEEKSAMEEKEKKEKDFFAAMEANILKSLSKGVIPGTPAQNRSAAATKEETSEAPDDERNANRKSSLRRVRSRAGRPEYIRTISTMDESVLTDVIRRQPSFRSVKANDFDDSSGSDSEASEGSFLETLEEDASELDVSQFSREDSLSKLSQRSMSIRNDLNYQETKALNKLFSLTKEMMDADKEQPNDNLTQRSNFASRPVALRRATDPGLGALRRATDTLPRELELGDSDGKKEKEKEKSSAPTTSRRGRAARMLANSGKTAKDLLQTGVPRRNTCGTMYIRTTMSAPDKDATIRCVCGVYRSHIISSVHMYLGGEESESLAVFNDYPDDVFGTDENPTLDEITTFYRDIFYKAQMEADCIIMSLIYVERLIKKTAGHLRPKATNWRSLLFSCMILSSKVWDDLSMWNADFSQSCPPGGVNFSLQRINQLELAILNTLKFNVKVPASEYAKYYFLLRSMLIKSGLGGEDLGSLDPLDVDGARKLAQVSSQFESMSLTDPSNSPEFQRSKSLAVESSKTFGQPKKKLGLEHIVKM